LRERPDFAEVKVSPLLLVAKALLMAVRRHPQINASWDEENQEIVVKNYVNLGIAAATERGLIVPNIKDADARTLPELAESLKELTDTARSGKTSPADMSGGTINVTNVGVFGVDAGTSILNQGEAAILAFGQIRDMPWVHEGELAVRKVTTRSLSFDHRRVDGELGSKVLRDIGTALEDPELTALAWGWRPRPRAWRPPGPQGGAREKSEGPVWHHHTGPYPRGGPVPQKGKGTGPSDKCARCEGWSNLTPAFFPVVTETSPLPGHREEETPSRCFPCSGCPDETVGGADGDHDERGQGQQRVVEPAHRTPPAVHPHGHGKAQRHHGQGDGQGQGE